MEGAAAGHHVHFAEGAQGGDGGDDGDHERVGLDRRDDDVAHDLPPTSAIDAGGFFELGWDALQAGQIDDHVVRRGLPHGDHGHGKQGNRRLGQPRGLGLHAQQAQERLGDAAHVGQPRRAADAQPLEEGVEQAVGVVQPLPDDAGDDDGGDDWNVVQGAKHLDQPQRVVEQERHEKREHDERGHDDDRVEQGIGQDPPEQLVAPSAAKIVEADEGGRREDVVAVQAEIERVEQGIGEEHD